MGRVEVEDELRQVTGKLPAIEGRLVLTAIATGHGRLWELCVASAGDEPAQPDTIAPLLEAWKQRLTEHGFTTVLPPRALPNSECPIAEGAEVFAIGLLQLQVRSHTPNLGNEALQAVRSIQAVREDSEQSVLRLGTMLKEVLVTSREQCEEIANVVRQFERSETDGNANLSSSLQALEGEVTNLGETLADHLGQQRRDVEGAAASATDIIELAAAVDRIAQSARLLTFNARVESARLGDQGRGFVVIANAIRDLAADVRSSNQVVTRLAKSLAAALPELERGTGQLARDTDRRLELLRSRLAMVRTGFDAAQAQTLGGLRSSETAAKHIRDKSNNVIQDLQFQDRASQLLRHAADQVQALEQALGAREEAPEDLIKRVGDLGRKIEGTSDAMAPSAIELF